MAETNFKFSEWDSSYLIEGEKEREKSEDFEGPEKRCRNEGFNLDIDAYEDNIKWEMESVSQYLSEVRRRKFFAINASIVLFPGLVSAVVAIVSTKLIPKGEEANLWVVLLFVSMFIGAANMIAIKYIAAFKSQFILALRQISCLRQALDSITYLRIEGKFPIHRRALMRGSVYYKIFGKHRKLPIGNEGYRGRFQRSPFASADMTLIHFLYINSIALMLSPFMYVVPMVRTEWDTLTNDLMRSYGFEYSFLLTAGGFIAGIFIIGVMHFRKIEKVENIEEEDVSEAEVIDAKKVKCHFKLNVWDIGVTIVFILLPLLYWVCVGIDHSENIKEYIGVLFLILSIVITLLSIRFIFYDSLNRIYNAFTTKSDSCFNDY